jgi:hypothetical protein
MATAQASTDPDLGFPPKGSLRRFGFPRLLREVARGRMSGSLYLLSGQTKKVVFFEEGYPIFVRSNVLSECLGQILAQEGLITQEQCEQTLEAIRRTGKKQGELLVEMGILSEGNLRYGLEAQLRAKLFDIFSWEDGRYQFKKDPPNLHFGIKLDTTPEGVIVEGIQDVFDDVAARDGLATYLDKYPTLRHDEAELDKLGLLPEERYHIGTLDGSRVLSEVLDTQPDPPVPSIATLVFGLLQAGLVQLSPRALPARAAPPRPTLGPGAVGDRDLAPTFTAQSRITEYEDTPLPGQMPTSPGLLDDHEDDFAGVADDSGPIAVQVSVAARVVEVAEELVAAQPSAEVDETFEDDQIELIDDDDMLAMDDGDDLVLVDAVPTAQDIPHTAADLTSGSDMDPDADLADLAAELATDLATDLGPEIDPELDADLELAPDISDIPLPPEPIDVPVPRATARAESEPIQPPLLDAGPTAVDRPAAEAGLGHVGADDDLLLSADDDLALGDDEDLLAGDSDLDGGGFRDDDLAAEDEFDDIDLGLEENAAAGDALGHPHVVAGVPAAAPVAARDPSLPPTDEPLLSFDDLDGIDLGPPALGQIASAQVEDLADSIDPVSIEAVPLEDSVDEPDEEDNPEVVGAIRFNEAESALADGMYHDAVAALEAAYEHGFDVAELHAMLAYARFMAAGEAADAADHSLELLDYAQNMDPSLDLVHAYRGAIYRALGESDRARESLDRALELNPYCELAMEIMDSLG